MPWPGSRLAHADVPPVGTITKDMAQDWRAPCSTESVMQHHAGLHVAATQAHLPASAQAAVGRWGHLQVCPTLKRAHTRAVTCHLRLGDFEGAQGSIAALRALPDSGSEAAASQREKDGLTDCVQQVTLLLTCQWALTCPPVCCLSFQQAGLPAGDEEMINLCTVSSPGLVSSHWIQRCAG